MFYILHMYGKWLDRSGKMRFETLDSLEKYLWEMIYQCHRLIAKEIGSVFAMEKLHLSYSIYEIGDESPLKKAFLTTPVIPQIIFTPRKRDLHESAARKIDSCMEKQDQIGNGRTERVVERERNAPSWDKTHGVSKQAQEKRE